MTLEEYIPNFVGYNIPSILVELLAFENDQINGVYYSEGFELIVDDKYGLSTWSDNPLFLNRLIPFAQADGTGSFYAIWVNEKKDLSTSPIVIFGSEGGYHIVACHLLELLQLLSLDVEPMVDLDGVYYYKDDANYEQSPGLRKFKKWLRLHYPVSPISNNFAAENIIDNAQKCYQEKFWKWTNLFIPQEPIYLEKK